MCIYILNYLLLPTGKVSTCFWGIICYSSYYADGTLVCLKENNKDMVRFYKVFLLRSILYSPLNFQVIKAATK